MRELTPIEKKAVAMTRAVGSTTSLIVHTILFLLSFVAVFVGLIAFDRMLLALTTIVSLEAIYLAIFIQMSVNRQSDAIAEVEHDIDEIQEDVDEIHEDLEEMEETDEEEAAEEERKRVQQETLQSIHAALQHMAADIEAMKK